MKPTACPPDVLRLVETFDSHIESYKSGQYNETQLRRQFIDPFYKALGWDVANEAGIAEAYKDVVHEDSIRIEQSVKAPDYCFRIGGTRKFFLETKKPSVFIKEDISPAYQLRRYAWSAKLPLSLLSDFEEFAVYDARVKPEKTDKASVARVQYFTYKDYPEKWEEIASIFSKEAVLKGSFDKYAESKRLKRGTATVDDAFLAEIESWRDHLARNIALRNPDLTQPELNFCVQRTIDRIVFLRICEDRGIEDYGRLEKLGKGTGLYRGLVDFFSQADDRYNSGLFHFQKEKDRHEEPDQLTPKIEIDDKPLKEILRRLYYPESPYEFSVLPADILGQVYEQFLGKVIRLTAGHQAKVEEKPEVRKAGGVYYTPTYIVDYIVKNTVGKLLEGWNGKGLSPKEAAKLRVLDPACGSGSFLLGAYQHLLDWHRDWYVNDDPKKWSTGKNPVIYEAQGKEWRLTTAERKRILVNNIYGVDIDSQAVEVTKLSLLLKVLEGESSQSLSRQLTYLHQRALPDLGDNIKCGNSLIGSDFFQQQSLLEDEERMRINAFDWDAEFPEIMKAGGFDAVIGNPPWGASFSDVELHYLRFNYSRVISRMIDSYIYFMDRAIQVAKKVAPVSFIVPSTILNQVDAQPIRDILLDRGVSGLISLGQGIFGSEVLNTSTIFITGGGNGKHERILLANLTDVPLANRAIELKNVKSASRSVWEQHVIQDPHKTFFTDQLEATALLNQLRRKLPSLSSFIVGTIQRGVSPDVASAHVISELDAKQLKLERGLLRPGVSGSQIKRYRDWKVDQHIVYTTRDTQIKEYPQVTKHLTSFRAKNTCKEVVQNKHPWWSLHRPRDPHIFESPKFVGLTTAKTIELIYDPDASIYVTDAMYLFKTIDAVDPWAFMAIMQSRLFLFLYRTSNQGESRVIPQVKASKLESLPFPLCNQSSPESKRLSMLCNKLYELNRVAARTPVEQTALQRQIDATDRQIDRLVYELYGLTEEEIKIVEGKQE